MSEFYRGKYKEFIESIDYESDLKYSEVHHITPRSVGGTDDDENLISLSLRDHFIAHKILYYENPDNPSLFFAYWMMCNTRVNTCTPEEYEEAKIEARKKISELNTGREFSDSHKKNLSDALAGRKQSDEHRNHNSEGQRGKIVSQEVRDKIARTLSTNCNPMNSEENRKKVSESKSGRIWINNSIEMKQIYPEEFEDYAPYGYVKGMIRTKHIVSKDYDCQCKICHINYKGGKYSTVCKECYSEMKRKERVGGIINE